MHFNEFAITSLRVIRKTGLLTRSVRQIPLEKVQDLNIRVTLWGRWLSFGDMELQTAGSDGTVVFPCIHHPEEFRNVLFAHLPGQARATASAPASPATRPTAEEQLEELERLISESEYAEKRRAVLGEL